MTNRRIAIFMLLLACSFTAHAQTDTLLNRYQRYLIDMNKQARVEKAWLTLDTAGRWADIDYEDKLPANWKTVDHLKRVRDLATAWADQRSAYYHQSALAATTLHALDHWLQKRYRNNNWWHNEIGVPQVMRDIIILLRDTLSGNRLVQSLEVLAQYRLHDNSTGANLVWSADLGLHYGALTGDSALIKSCLQRILNEVRITAAEGVQPDYSFHQHGARLQMYQYGHAFLFDNIRLAWQLHGTAWAYPEEKKKILTDFILEGWQWMARGIQSVPGTMDRSASRVNALQGADIRELLPLLVELEPQKEGDFKKLVDWQNGKGQALQGFRYFPYSDFAAYQQPQFSFFLKTISDRTLASESINFENLKGRLLNSGDAYIIKNGKEYVNLMPVWNWALLPGVTGFAGAAKINRQPFAGSVSDGKSGLTVMDYQLKDTGSQLLTAKKFWACYNNQVICLIAGLQKTPTDSDSYTSLDQCRWQSDVTVNTQKAPLKAGNYKLSNITWLHHAGLAYIFLQPAAVNLHLNTVTDSWQSINRSGPVEPVTEKVFNPVLLHPVSAKPIATGYVLASCKTAADAQQLAARPEWKVLRNDTVCQAVWFNADSWMVAFYAPASILIGKKLLSVQQPCLVMMAGNKLYVSDPAQKQEIINLQFGSKKWNVVLPQHGVTAPGIVVP